MFFRIKFYLDVFQNFGLIKGIIFLIRKKLKTNKLITLPSITHPINLRPGTSDEKAFMQIFLGKEYEVSLDFEPKVIIDGGANVGFASIYFKNKYKNAKIVAIEPDPDNTEALRKNLSGYDNVFIKQAGLWSKRTTTLISDKYGLGKWGMVIEEVNDYEGEQQQNGINTVTINDIMDEYNLTHIDVLKLDIESAEKKLFSDNYMDWLPKTKVIIVELHDWMSPGCSKTFFTAINAAIDNYAFYQIGENTVIINQDLVNLS